MKYQWNENNEVMKMKIIMKMKWRNENNES